MRILTYSTLYPNAAQPAHGIFVETRLKHLCARHPVEARVVAPVPWFPFRSPRFGSYAAHARAPRRECRGGLEVSHPRYPVLPKVGMNVAPELLAWWSAGEVERIRREGFDFDLVDAHYFYPDGVAAAMIAARLGKPLVITARGTDINLIPRFARPRRLIRWAAQQADAIVTVCEALADAIRGLGIEHPEIHTLRNGVDLELFQPAADREALRRALGFTRTTLVSVGHLIERKGHHLVIEALHSLPDVDLVILGDGEERARLEAQVARAGLGERVRFEGAVSQHRLRECYGAADALVLASSREGWANVLLEAMACATPVVATPVWGTPEVVAAPEAGVLTRERSAAAIADGCRHLLASPPPRAATRAYAERFGWDPTSDGLWALLGRVAGGAAQPHGNALAGVARGGAS